LAVFSMLTDKDIPNSLLAISAMIDCWYVAPLNTKRAASMEKLQSAFQEAGIEKAVFLPSIEAAYKLAFENAKLGDRLIIFGSFHTVSEVWAIRKKVF
jgi:dihydrofolate synthase / folylpolyglutamate synthase